MLTLEQLEQLRYDLENEHVERTRAFDKADKMGQAICAFANDLGNHNVPGYLLLGVENDGRLSGKRIDDEHLTSLGGMKSEGNLLPPPAMAIETFHFDDGDVVAIEVFPSKYPPIRYQGQVWIRIGARKALATEEDIHILEEKRLSHGKRFEELPCISATLDDLNLDLFRNLYLPRAIRAEVIDDDPRPVQQQMAALRFYDSALSVPTNLGMLLFGKHPELHIPSAYLQYVKFGGQDNGANILAEHAYKGPFLKMIDKLEAFVKVGIASPHPVRVSPLKEETFYDYPDWGIRELLLNAIIHRDYLIGNAPIKFYNYNDSRLEISNPGGLYGQVNPDNFPYVSDYRNPLLAEALKVMGYVNKFNRGIAKVKDEMKKNGNPLPIFDVNKRTEYRVTVLPVVMGDGILNDTMNHENTDMSHENTDVSHENTDVSHENGTRNGTGGTRNGTGGTRNGTGGTRNSTDGTRNSTDGTHDSRKTPFDSQKIVEVIALHPGIQRKAMAQLLGISLRSLARYLKTLSSPPLQKIEHRGTDKTGGWFIRS